MEKLLCSSAMPSLLALVSLNQIETPAEPLHGFSFSYKNISLLLVYTFFEGKHGACYL